MIRNQRPKIHLTLSLSYLQALTQEFWASDLVAAEIDPSRQPRQGFLGSALLGYEHPRVDTSILTIATPFLIPLELSL